MFRTPVRPQYRHSVWPHCRHLLGAVSLLGLNAGVPHAAMAQDAAQSEQIDFTADQLEYDQNSEVVTASGNVILNREEQSLRADSVTWNRVTGEVVANGDVEITDENNNKLYGDNIVLTDDIRDGAIDNILVVLEEGGRLAATKGVRENGFITLDQASYTACAVETPENCPKRPSWQVKAVKVIYNPNTERVSYEGARLELFGLPLIPMPGFSHQVGGQSGRGLLLPDLKFSSANGAELSLPYYIPLAPNRDITLTGYVYSEELPMVSAKYRALTDDGAYQITGYATASSRIPVGTTGATTSEGDFRGYIDASGKFQLSPLWSISGSLRAATDRTYLRRYDISRDDRLRSTFAIERIDQQSYFAIKGWATQTLRVNAPQGQVPIALPIIDYRYRPAASFIGGKLDLQFNTLAIGRTGGQDTQRAFASAKWDLRRLTKWGQELTLTAYARGDVYHSDENDLTSTVSYRGATGFQSRASGSIAADVRWPLVGEFLGGTQVLTPRFQIVATPTTDNLDIPNEDARAVDLEDSNLFALNRFPGYDRIEDGVRFTYGVEWQFNRPGLSINSIVGQSYRLSNRPTILPDGTGLTDRSSDYVGRTEVRLRDFISFVHRFRLDKDNLAVRRNEIDTTVGTRSMYATVGYLRLNRNITNNIEDLRDREELRVGARVPIARYWSVFGSGVFDLTDQREDPGSQASGFEPIRTRLGIAYEDDCLELGLTWRRDSFDTGDAQKGDTFLIRLAFKNLGF